MCKLWFSDYTFSFDRGTTFWNNSLVFNYFTCKFFFLSVNFLCCGWKYQFQILYFCFIQIVLMLSRLGSVNSTMPCSYFFKHVFNVARHFVQQGGFLYSHNSDIPAEHVCFGVDEYLWVLNCFLCWKGVWTERWDLMILATISSCWNSSACFYRFAGTERRNTSRSFAKLFSMYCINTARNDLVNSTTCVSFVVVLQPRLWHATQSLETSVRGPHVTGEVETCCFWKY